MKVEIYQEKKQPDQIFLTLKKRGDYVDLIVVSEDGKEIDGGCLLEVDKDGIVLSRYVNPSIGLPLDENKRVLVKKG